MSHYTGLNKKGCFYQIKTFPRDLLLYKLVEKKFSEEFLASFWDSHFLVLNYQGFFQFPQKRIKTPEKLSFALGSLWGAKMFSVIFISFHLYEHKKLFH